MGNIKPAGHCDIDLSVNSLGDFEMKGDYLIDDGNFFFTLQNLMNRRFTILEGGKISWTGSPYDADVDIRALYKTKASLEGLGIEEEGTRANVDCYLGMKEQLMDPVIKFGVDFPNLDHNTIQEIYARLDTTNEVQMNQQMIFLLVLGSFSIQQDQASQIGASSVNIISNQLSSWLSQISKDFDIGINYLPGDDMTKEQLEVALSTQLFDNRVVIDGNVGVMGKQQSSNTSSIVGDVNVEVKITPDGRFRVKAFNRSNVTTSINTLDEVAPYTQGVGIFYRKEFDSFGDLFKKK